MSEAGGTRQPESPPQPTAAADGRIRTAIAAVLGRIAPEADLSSVSPDTNLRREFDLDSVDFQNFLVGLAKELGRDIPDRQAGSLTSIAACEEQLGGQGRPGRTE